MSHEIFEFLRQNSQEMAAEYERIRSRSQEDPGTAGDEGEENWAAFFRNWLPPHFHVVTKGRILGPKGEASPQIDILVLDPNYPQRLHNKKMYLAGGVVAAFECKLTLRPDHIEACLETSKFVHELAQPRSGSLYKELFSGVLYGLLAHSQAFAANHNVALEKISEQLFEHDRQVTSHPRQMLDIVCVADLATWTPLKLPMVSQIMVETDPRRHIFREAAAVSSTVAGYMCANMQNNVFEGFSPIGLAYFEIMRRLAWEVPTLRRLVAYLSEVGFVHQAGGRSRNYAGLEYSEACLRVLQKREFQGGHLLRLGPWDEFCF